MIYWLDEPRRRSEIAARRSFHVTLALSLLIHVAALVVLVQQARIVSPGEGPERTTDRLQVRMAAAAPKPAPPPAPTLPQKMTPITRSPAPLPKITTPTSRPPPVIAAPRQVAPMPAPAPTPSASTPSPPTPPGNAPSQATRPVEGDLSSYIQARRRERGEPASASISNESPELNAQLASNLPRPATGTATAESNHGGGIFEIKRMTYDDAAFLFFGWNKDMGRQTPQLIVVRLGQNADMRIAVVRRMIAIIREYTQEDFYWRSVRHEGGLVLSARQRDNAGLESFLLHEFFDARGEPQ
jgi:hypothetical protein